MNIRKKGAAVAFSATLLASMIAVIAAPLAFASTAVTSAGTVPRGGTSTGTASFTFTENTAACFPNAVTPDALDVTILDSAAANTVSFSGTPVVIAPGSLGATASVSGNVLTINFAGADTANIEQITVSGLKIAATSAAATGAISATLGGADAACVSSPTPATGTVSVGIGAGATSVIMNNTGSCLFVVTGTITPGGTAGNLVFANGDSVAITAVAAGPGVGQQTLTIGATGTIHNAAETASQANVCAPSTALGSPGTVANALTETATFVNTVVPGENNQPAGTVTLSEVPSGTANTFAAGQVVTFAITNPASGVRFSASPNVSTSGGTITLASNVCTLSLDSKSCTVTITAASNVTNESLTLNNVKLDVDSTVPLGTAVKVTASVSPTVAINVVSSTIANIGRVIVGTAAQPTIYIGFNDQPSGLITLTESGAGFFQAGVGTNNSFGLCLATGETFTRAPWAVVTVPGGVGPAGLQLLSGVVGVSQVQGTLYHGGTCAMWTVYSASTTGPGTIEIRGSADNTTPLPTGANNGPRLSVPNGLTPGTTQSVILVGDSGAVGVGCPVVPFVPQACAGFNPAAFSSIVSNAVRAFKNSVTITAASQPLCPPGTLDCLLGNVVITETQNGQFKMNDVIRGYFLPDSKSLRNDILIKAGNTNDLPIITTNSASGLLVSPVIVVCPPNIPALNICFFAFIVTQQSFGPTLGQVTISNIHATIAKDATPGPIQMDWGNTGLVLGIPVAVPPVNGQTFESVVSNGAIGTGPTLATTKTSVSSAVGKTNTASAFTVGTKVVHLVAGSNNIVTVRIKVDPALVGKSVTIERAVKSASGTWSSFTKLTTRVIGADGYAYYYASAHSKQWVSYRGFFAGATVGNTQYGTSRSQAVQVRWL